MTTTTAHEPQHAYDGPAGLGSEDRNLEVEVALRGVFQPIDGHFHWYGRISGSFDDLRNGQTVTIVTPHGRAEGRLTDVDPWGRYRISGVGRPPF